MKTSQNPSLGSSKPSPPHLKFKKAKSSSDMKEKLSKYLCGKESSTTQNSQQLDSPFKNSLKEIKYSPSNDDLSKDFQTPKPIKVQKRNQDKKPEKKPLKGQNKQASRSRSSKRTASLKNNYVLKATRVNLGISDVNPDHLQMALALSKSTYETENPESSINKEESFPIFLTPDRIPKAKTILERYGFKSDKPKLDPDLRKAPQEVPRKKNSKFRYITPTLKCRTAEERQSIVASKIALLLCGNKNYIREETISHNKELCSDMLKTFQRDCRIFSASGFNLGEKVDKYYNKTLNILPSRSNCGCLLKQWEDIPGREKSPIRGQFKCQQVVEESTKNLPTSSFSNLDVENIDLIVNHQTKSCTTTSSTNVSSISQNLSSECSMSRYCSSPDLFDYASEEEIARKMSDSEDELSQSILSPSKKRKSLLRTQSTCSQQSEMEDEILKSNSLATEGDCVYQFTDDENTEELYLSSLKTKNENLVLEAKEEEGVTAFSNSLSDLEDEVNLTQNSPSKSKQFSPEHSENKGELIKECNDVSNKQPPRNETYSTDTKSSFIDLTVSSPSNDATNYASERTDNLQFMFTQDPDNNFDMSPLHLKYSDGFVENNVEDEDNILDNINNRHSTNSTDSFEGDVKDRSSLLNVTDYIHQILSQDDSEAGDISLNDCKENDIKTIDLSKEADEDEFKSSQESCSQESIIISDEELNYSSVYSKNTKCHKFYSLSDTEVEVEEDYSQKMDIDNVYSIHAALKNKYRDDSTPVHNRISELKANSLSKKSLQTAFLEDSFNDVLENTTVIKTLEKEAEEKLMALNEPTSIDPTNNFPSASNTCTPEKSEHVSVATNGVTPENNLIIKTKDITPLANYDEMDTPGIAKELNKFGLKPLKRRRGTKLLKYLYECTHPFVGPQVSKLSSSDKENSERLAKRRKKLTKLKHCSIYDKYDLNSVEIVGDALLKNENLDELIFERKYSTKIPSCRVPLQIVWHNFLSENAEIRENILLYEPLQLEVLHTMIKEQTGCKFHIQDLLTFFDRKCITIRTAQGNQGGKRKV